MTGYGKMFLMVASAAVSTLGASVASAATVNYTTTGNINGAGATAVLVGGYRLDYAGITRDVLGSGPANATGTVYSPTSFGTLTLTKVSGVSSLTTTNFTITVTQNTPTAIATPDNTFTGTLTGNITIGASGTVSVVFPTDNFIIYTGTPTIDPRFVGYFINPTNTANDTLPASGNAVDVSLGGTIIFDNTSGGNPVVPLPPAALAGGALLSGLGAVRRVRRAITA